MLSNYFTIARDGFYEQFIDVQWRSIERYDQ